ncbi:MAG: M48 family metalloprotease [Sphingomonadaceae bacterium]
MKKLLLISAAFLAVSAGAQAQLPTAQPITASDKAQGAKAHPELLAEFGGAYTGPQADYVRRVGQKIATQSGLSNTQSDFTITLLNSSVNNAFAIPGGYVYVTRQLLGLMNDEAELASVMGHEVGHVAARHSQKRNQKSTIGSIGAVLATIAGAAVAGDTGAKLGQQLGGTLAQAYVLGYSRSQEYQADDLGVSYLARGGYDPIAASDMLSSLAAETTLEGQVKGTGTNKLPKWASTHPDPASRVSRAAQKAAVSGGTGKARNRDAFLAAINGMLYDDDPKQGVIEGQVFSHPDLKLSFTAPAGYSLSNGPDAVTISGSGGRALFSGASYTGDLDGYLNAAFRSIGGNTPLPVGPISRTQINGIPVAYASASANSQGAPIVVTVYAYEFSPRSAFHMATITPANEAGNLSSLFQSVRRMTDAEAAGIKPRILRVVTVKSGDTVQSLAQRMAYKDFQEARFQTLNALSPGATLTPGQKVKLIVY